MTTAIIGVGSIGSAVATDLTAGGESVVLAATTQAKAEKLADELGDTASVATVPEAVAQADTVIFAVWLDALKGLVQQLGSALDGKVVIDPSNPVAIGSDGQASRTLPEDVSAASEVAGVLSPGAKLVKAFGTLGAGDLSGSARRTPERAVLFYAADDASAEGVVQRLITAAGFEPVKVGGLDQALRIEMFGDLHQFGGLDGKVLNADEARAAVSSRKPARG